MDGIGANEYIVTVTQKLVDFYSAGDTPAPWELNMWYHTLNCGFTTRLSGETDFPCIFDERVGIARSYFKPEGPLSYDSYVQAIKKGRSYVSEGNSHIIDFSVNGLELGTGDSRLALNGPQSVRITAKVVAHLPVQQDEAGAKIAQSEMKEQPYWSIERARIGTSQKVRVELIVNGEPVDTAERVELEHGGDGALVLDVGEPADQDGEFRITAPLRDYLAALLHIAEFEVQSLARPAQLLTCFFHAMILSLGVDRGGGECGEPSSRDYSFTLFAIQ